MEIFINSNERLTNCQTRVLKSVSIMQPGDLLLLGGESGTGKTATLINAANVLAKTDH